MLLSALQTQSCHHKHAWQSQQIMLLHRCPQACCMRSATRRTIVLPRPRSVRDYAPATGRPGPSRPRSSIQLHPPMVHLQLPAVQTCAPAMAMVGRTLRRAIIFVRSCKSTRNGGNISRTNGICSLEQSHRSRRHLSRCSQRRRNRRSQRSSTCYSRSRTCYISRLRNYSNSRHKIRPH